MRLSKTVGTTEYKYYYAGDKLMRMTVSDGTVMDFIYGSAGEPYAVKYNGTVYYYILNLQGDVVRIVNSAGTSFGIYKYDAWGNVLYRTSGNLMKYNPLRYRGYVYDEETKFYYLSSRYYDPEIGRFINADGLMSTGQGVLGYNMFAYCGNCPVTNVDRDGMRYCVVELLGGNTTQYIVDQNAAPYGTKELQDVTVGYGGCGVVASYNALITLGNAREFDDVLAYYNEDPNRTFMNGQLGILPGQISSYFKSLGYSTIITNSIDEIDVLSKQADACIMFYMFTTQKEFCGISLKLPAAHFVEYKYDGIQYVGRNTSASSGVSRFNYPSDYFYQGMRVYAEAVFIFK